MQNKLTSFLFFAGGAGIGSLITWFVTKKKYQQKLDEAVVKMHETLNTQNVNEPKEEEVIVEPAKEEPEVTKTIAQNQNNLSLENDLQKRAAEINREKPNVINYNKMVKDLNYIQNAESNDGEYYSEYPYLIKDGMTPYGEKEDADGNPYDKITLMYYEDGVIADTADEIIDDIDDTIGTENLSHFGDYPNKDCIYVRNDRLQADFMVCMSNLTWEVDILGMKPYLRN